MRESPTLQLLAVMKEQGLPAPAVYDPMVSRDIAERQYHDFDAFLAASDLVVVLVGHAHLRENLDKLAGKAVLDTRHVCGDKAQYSI